MTVCLCCFLTIPVGPPPSSDHAGLASRREDTILRKTDWFNLLVKLDRTGQFNQLHAIMRPVPVGVPEDL